MPKLDTIRFTTKWEKDHGNGGSLHLLHRPFNHPLTRQGPLKRESRAGKEKNHPGKLWSENINVVSALRSSKIIS
jgi:hypothetical protein